MSTRTNSAPPWPTPLRAALRAGVSGLVAVTLLAAATPARATPWAAPSPALSVDAPAVETPSAGASSAAPNSVEGALEAGDLTTAKQLARAAREAEPTAAAWQREGEVLEQAGEYREAAKAYRAAKRAASQEAAAAPGKGAKATKARNASAAAIASAEESLVRVKAMARGTVADEPVSTHREQLDPRWEPPPPKPAQPEPEPEPLPEPEPERIVTKWYFWVTVGAIAASAAAVTAIAIRAARDEQPDALSGLSPGPAPRGLGALRF